MILLIIFGSKVNPMESKRESELKLHLYEQFKLKNLDVRAISAFEKGYCNSQEVQKTIREWVAKIEADKDDLFSSTSMMETDEWLDHIKTKSQELDKAQNISFASLYHQFYLYRKEYPQDNPSDISEEYLKSFFNLLKEGFCNGIATLVSYALRLEKQPIKDKMTPRDDWTWLKHVFDLLAEIEKGYIQGKRKICSPTEIQDIERALSLIVYFQNIHLYLPTIGQGELHKSLVDTQNNELKRHYSIAGKFTEAEIQKILEELLNAKTTNKSKENDFQEILLSSHDHDITITKIGSSIYFYESLNFIGPLEINNPKDLAELIFLASEFEPNLSSPIGIRVFGLGEKPDYPSQEKLLSNLTCTDEKSAQLTSYADNFTRLETAASIGCVESIRFFLKQNPKLNLHHDRSFHTAVNFHYVDAVEELLKYDPSIINSKINLLAFSDTLGIKDGTALHVAAVTGDEKLAEVLLKNGADIDAKNSTGLTPLHLACEYGRIEIVYMLLNKNVNIDAIDNKKRRAIDFAIANGHKEIVGMLLQVSHNIDLNDLLYRAVEYGSPNVIPILFKNDSDKIKINEPVSPHQKTVLQLACELGNPACVKILVENGAKIDISDIALAKDKGHTEVVKLLEASIFSSTTNLKITKIYGPLFSNKQSESSMAQNDPQFIPSAPRKDSKH